jgi:hypothetical protein
MKTFLTTLAVLTVIATPAFSQSFDPEFGTGNVLSLRSEPTATGIDRFAVRQNGLHAQALVPRVRRIPRARQSGQSREYGVVGFSARPR